MNFTRHAQEEPFIGKSLYAKHKFFKQSICYKRNVKKNFYLLVPYLDKTYRLFHKSLYVKNPIEKIKFRRGGLIILFLIYSFNKRYYELISQYLLLVFVLSFKEIIRKRYWVISLFSEMMFILLIMVLLKRWFFL